MDILARLAICGALAITAGALAAQDIPPDGWEGHPDDLFYQDDSFDTMPTKVTSVDDLSRLINNKGIGLQWMDAAGRGRVRVLVDVDTGRWMLDGSHSGPNNTSFGVDGFISEVGDKYFTLFGSITIMNTPDQGRECAAFGNWRFEITQNRKYYRLRDFEWCDYLTDYIDIYF